MQWLRGASHLDTHIRRRSADKPEGCADMDLDNDIPGIVWGSMQHAVIGKASIVYDVIQLSILPTSATPGLSSALSSGHEAGSKHT